MTRDYELTVVLTPQLPSDKKEKAIKQVSKLVTDLKGKIEETEEWGEKHLAYQIKGHDQGLFVHLTLNLATSSIDRLETKLKLVPELIRLLLVKKESQN